MKKHVLGFPRFGAKRELKKALEAFWKGETSVAQLDDCAKSLRLNHWNIQKNAGLDFVATGDFSCYDHVLDTCVMLGAVPERFRHLPQNTAETYFIMARGDQATGIPAMEMTKWFNTNYHYIVPEIAEDFQPEFCGRKIINETREAIAAGFNPKPVLVGPVTFLALGKGVNGFDVWKKLDAVTDVYAEIIGELSGICEWIQLDEPVLSSELAPEGRAAFHGVYEKLNAAAGKSQLLLATYFDTLDDNLDLALGSGCAGLHLDLVRGGANLDEVLAKFPGNMILSAGIVEGRNIWKNDFEKSLTVLRKIQDKLGDCVMVGSSCSLLHSPVDLANEVKLDPTIKNWMAFAVQKCSEVSLLCDLASGISHNTELAENRKAIQSRHADPRLLSNAIDAGDEAVTDTM